MKNVKAVFYFENYLPSKGITRTATVTWTRIKPKDVGFNYSISVNTSDGRGCSITMRGTPAIKKPLHAIKLAEHPSEDK